MMGFGIWDLSFATPPSSGTRRNLTVWVALFFLVIWAFSTHTHAGSFNDRSRMAAIESRVTRETWIIDESPFSRTVDRILVDGHFYSDKPPVLSFIASGVYAILHKGLHLSLDASWCDFDEGPCHCRALCDDNPDWAYYLLTLTLVGIPSALMLALFYHMTGFLGLDNPAALLLTATLGLATPIFPYSTVFNSHLPTAACLLFSFYALLRARWPRAQDLRHAHWWLLVAGFLAALAFTLDLGAGLFLVAFFGYVAFAPPTPLPPRPASPRPISVPLSLCVSALRLRVFRHRAWPYLLGGLLPIACIILLDYQIVGNPLPPYMYTSGYDYPGSRFPQTIAGNRSPENVAIYGLRLLFGDHGLFALSPILIWAVVALVQVWRDRNHPWRPLAVLIGTTSGLFSLYFILFTDNFGGAAYGPRWYTAFIPLLFLFIAIKRRKEKPKNGKATQKFAHLSFSNLPLAVLFLALTAISLINSYYGALNPWRTAPPLLWVEYAPPERREPVDMALSGITFEEIQPDIRSALATRRVDKRWFDARSCLIIPPDPMWLFIGPGTPLDPALAERSGLVPGGNLACYVDLRPAKDAYLDHVTTAAWTTAAPGPPDSDSLTSVPLPADFSGQLSFLGYEWGLPPSPTGERAGAGVWHAGEDLALITTWRVEGRPEPPLSIFIHLLNPQGQITGQFDGLGANPDGLRRGDVLLHVHRIAIAPDAPPGLYWLQLGLYNPETMARLPLTEYGTERLLLAQIEISNR